ncbi:MAG: hypothetical protein NUV86_00070 [Candidatus Scalindua sp.]|nr:hypothetical protein [Candidatus Scalindua sp.]MCR4343124.1 hypothetical protein [Candidatus Scalindua sp.]
MKTKGRRVAVHHRKHFKWWLRNNLRFIIIAVALSLIVALIFGYQVYTFNRIKSMEALLGKTQYDIHRKTGLTDQDVSKLRKVYPDFNWEETWDRKRWQMGQAEEKEYHSEELSTRKP